MRLAWMADRSRWHHSVHWSGALDVEVSGDRRFHETAEVDLERTVSVLTARASGGDLPALDRRVRDALRCPLCRSALTWAGRWVTCEEGHRYPLAGGIPILLREAAPMPVRGS